MDQGSFDDLIVQEKALKAKWIAEERQRLCREVGDSIDSKDLAAVAGISYQYTRAMLNRNGEKKDWNHEFDGALMLLAPDLYAEKVLAFDAEMTNRECQKKRLLTPEEENQLLREKLRSMHLDLHPEFKELF